MATARMIRQAVGSAGGRAFSFHARTKHRRRLPREALGCTVRFGRDMVRARVDHHQAGRAHRPCGSEKPLTATKYLESTFRAMPRSPSGSSAGPPAADRPMQPRPRQSTRHAPTNAADGAWLPSLRCHDYRANAAQAARYRPTVVFEPIAVPFRLFEQSALQPVVPALFGMTPRQYRAYGGSAVGETGGETSARLTEAVRIGDARIMDNP